MQGMNENEQQHTRENPQRTIALPQVTPARIVLAVALVIIVVFAARMCSTAATIDVTVNGTQYTIHGAKTMQTAIKESGLPINPGDLISLTGQLLKLDEGHPFNATVNGTPTTDPDYKLNNGDVIVVTDGDPIVEDYDAVSEPVPYGLDSRGLGAISLFTKGENGVLETRTGKLSGEVIEKQTVAPTDLTQHAYNPDVGSDKVIALTFDGGPDADYTPQILDVLAENGVKATFFCTADQVTATGAADLLTSMREAGHQICVFGYSDTTTLEAAELSKLSAEEQVAAIEDCRAGIESALGEPASKLVRLPAGYMHYDIMFNLEPYVETEIGWTIDTGDWANTSDEEIYDTLMMAKPGDVVRCHDGDGIRTNTVEALEKALPKLVSQGYSFVTVDEMLEYPQP